MGLEKAKSLLGADAIAFIVAWLAPAKPTATIEMPSFLSTDACSIASASVPPTVCLPSVDWET